MKDSLKEKGLQEEIASLRRRMEELERCGKAVSSSGEACSCEVFEFAMDGIFIIDLKGRYIDVNPAGCKMFGYRKEEFLSSDIRLLLFPEDVERSFKLGERDWRHGAFIPDYRMRRKDGSEAWVELTVKPFKRGGEDLVLGIKRDVTGRKKAQDGLLKTREELERKVKERTAELTEINSALGEEVKKRKSAEDTLKALIEGTSSVTGEEFLRSLVRHLASVLKINYAFIGELCGENKVRTLALWAGEDFAENIEYRTAKTPCEDAAQKACCRHSEKARDLYPEDKLLADMGIESYIGVPLFNSEKKPIGILVAMDNKPMPAEPDHCGILQIFAARASLELQRKKAEERLTESERKFRSMAENLPIGVSITNEAGDFLEANPALWNMFGYGSKEEFLKVNVSVLYVNPEDRRVCVELIKMGAGKDLEVRCRRKNGAEFLGSLTSVSQTSGENEARFISIFQDVTERKKIEAELLKAQKLDSIGVLAGGIAHDFNNLLLGILGNVSIAKNCLRPGDKAFELLDRVENAALRSKDLTKQLLTFSRGGEPLTEPSHIEQLIRDSASLVLRGTDVSCKFLFPRDLWPVEIDQGQIAQVINNIILNARQAMPSGGTVTVSAENIEAWAGPPLPLKSGSCVKIAIKDRGMGMPKKVLSKIFDPFFTTKKKASGLGLAISYSIIKKHRGHIGAESKPGEGSSFHIYLPSAHNEAEPESAQISQARRGKVLVMDDEDFVREVSGEMLELLGYTAGFAKNGEEAVELFRRAKEAGEPFDAVILDLTVPEGMGGKEALAKLIEMDPEVRAIVSSGYSKDPIMSEYHKHGFKGVIAKPYTVPEFGRAVNSVLAKR
ncbi:MAG: PAS domain S-box protein [Deltaproteobacteria bacterium]|nr:PAS domain S-box protein [Deltaproteobacteria bacterium]